MHVLVPETPRFAVAEVNGEAWQPQKYECRNIKTYFVPLKFIEGNLDVTG